MHWNVALWSAGLWVILSLGSGQLTEQEKSTIIDLHNELRSKVLPSAAFMQKVVWDEALRLVAEAYAVKCIWDHNPLLEDLSIGENLFVGTGPFNATKAVLDWFEEHVDYNFESNECTEDKMCGHYTQMIWADTNRIGCATHLCDTLEGLPFTKATLLVCDYFPQGNFEGQNPYESGDPCSKCPEKLPVCEDRICVAENLFNSSEKPGSDDTEASTVLPERPRMTTKPVSGPEEPTQVVNVEGKNSYESEEPCSKCPENLPVCEDRICVAENLFNSSEKPGSDDTKASTVLPERPRMTTKPVSGPEEPTQVYVKIERNMKSEASRGSEISASLATLVWLLLFCEGLKWMRT